MLCPSSQSLQEFLYNKQGGGGGEVSHQKEFILAIGKGVGESEGGPSWE